MYFATQLQGFPLELGISSGGQETIMMGVLGRKGRLTILLTRLDTIRQRDGRTNGQRTKANTAPSQTASHGKPHEALVAYVSLAVCDDQQQFSVSLTANAAAESTTLSLHSRTPVPPSRDSCRGTSSTHQTVDRRTQWVP